jgi:hypothetical protein
MAFHTTRFTSARRALSLVLLLALLLPELAARAQDTDVPATPAQAATTPLDGDFMGMVVRDPWFDFGTNPAFPGQPNKAFQDRMGATLAEMGVRWVRLDVRVAPRSPRTTISSTRSRRDTASMCWGCWRSTCCRE